MADVVNATDYYPFGMIMNERSTSTSDYRFGFNGKENDNEVKGEGNSLDYGARIYDHEVLHWLIGRYKGVHDDGPLVKGEIPHMMMTGHTDVTNADKNYVEKLPELKIPTLNTDKRIYTQKNASQLDIYPQGGNSFQVGSTTNILFDDSGKELPAEKKDK